MNRYPYGYSGSPEGMGCMLTWDEMLTKKTVYNLHPELLRRFKALIEKAASVGVPLGCGTGWRVQPNPPPPGFAKPGNSWHESCPTRPDSPTALGIDTVPNTSWDWMESNVASYGLRTFRYVNNEPWHIQPYEIPAGRSYATSLPPLQHFSLPGESTPDEDDDDMIFDGFWQRDNDSAVYAIFKNGTKQWIQNQGDLDAWVALQAINGANADQLSVRIQTDPCMFTAFGIVIGPTPQAVDGIARDEYGNRV